MIYFDLDGVLADFDGAYTNLTGIVWNYSLAKTEEQKLAKWEQIKKCPYFFRDLLWIPGAKDLILYARDRVSASQIGILSAATTKVPECAEEKAHWIERELPWIAPENRLIVANKKEKNRYARMSDGQPNILVDDWEPNIADWEMAGGIGIQFRDSAQVKEALRQHWNGGSGG
ncbi:MAG TPA: hypothetical protein VKU19_30080 [Bryobacteraceae bacterium]|nr:hypothetical protein [Bryobacteraceae bacterium]